MYDAAIVQFTSRTRDGCGHADLSSDLARRLGTWDQRTNTTRGKGCLPGSGAARRRSAGSRSLALVTASAQEPAPERAVWDDADARFMTPTRP